MLPAIDMLNHARKSTATSLVVERGRERENRFQWPLLAAFLLLTVELGFTDRKKR